MNSLRLNELEEGGSVMDALVAIVLTSILAGSVYVFLSGHTGHLFANLKQDRDILRFVILIRDFERRLEFLYCDWWKQGIRYEEWNGGAELQSEYGSQIDVLRVEVQGRVLLLSGPLENDLTTYQFESAVPIIKPIFDREGRLTSIQLIYSELLRASLYPQSRPLYLPDHFSEVL